MKKLLISLAVILTIFYSCKKANTTPPTASADAMARDTLYYIMQDWYYWYAQMPTVVKENYSDPYKLMDAMRYKAVDKWSFVEDYNTFIAEMQQGTFVGHGFSLGLDFSGNARIAMIYSNSPLYASGVRRGWIVKTINSTAVAPILIAGNATAYNNMIGPSTAGITNVFVFTKPDGTDVTISSTKASFQTNTVLVADTLHLKSGIAGHLVFDAFTAPAANELLQAFTYFKSNNIQDLILDLRYNGGGYLDVAQTLASYIGGNGIAGTTFAKLTYNDRHQDQNTSFPFVSTGTPLGLQRLVVITTRNTASASEAVMNGLKPFVNVVSVGDTTDGKPVGMNGWPVMQKYFMWPVTFKIVNNLNQGDYYKGIAPNKLAIDDITHDFNDRNEASFRQAINYLQTGSFSAKSYTEFKRFPNFSEKPGLMNNMFIRKSK